MTRTEYNCGITKPIPDDVYANTRWMDFLNRYVSVDGGCWVVDQNRRYPRIHIRGSEYLAHRVSCKLMGGGIVDGFEVDHLCNNKKCVNPAHLEPTTHIENYKRADKSRLGWKPDGYMNNNAKKTHCKRGHPFSGDNLAYDGGRRVCKTCRRMRAARKKAS
jgi:hypothetical protein